MEISMQLSSVLYFVLIMPEQDLTPPSLGLAPNLIRSRTSFVTIKIWKCILIFHVVCFAILLFPIEVLFKCFLV